jgi:site-specific DNA-methyltransferase (cytosine-N4-specific)
MAALEIGAHSATLSDRAAALLPDVVPAYVTRRGAAYCGDALDLIRAVPAESVDLVITSPPYA